MELRHLRPFVAAVEAGTLTEAAEKKLHASQPSQSREARAGTGRGGTGRCAQAVKRAFAVGSQTGIEID
jgi:hypothetical protein